MASLAELDRALRQKEVAAIYLVVGAEPYLRRTAVQRIVRAVQAVDPRVTPRRIEAGGTSATAVVAEAQGLGLFAQRECLTVHGVEAWKGEEWGVLADYAASPNPATTLVLVGDKVDGRSGGVKRVQQVACVVECKPLYPREVPEWIRMECQQRGKTISMDAARLLAETVGTELGALDQALERLILYCQDQPVLDAAAVERLIVETSQRTIFEFTGAVGNRDLLRAVKYLERLLSHGEPAVLLVTMLARHWRLLLRAQAAGMSGGQSEADLARLLKVHPFFVKEYLQQSRNIPGAQLRRGLTAIAHADRQIKRSRLPAVAVLTRCIQGLIRQ